ncbi:MAG: type II toxin-antitoxin system RelE/ParE family toxin [Syntrophomonadaceae bacterium]|nr:type II toxin-antitoxin system RelE/ParE family toxin [Syntrophomonadaceae bacterium]
MDDRFQLKITPAAANDLDQIYYYITNILVAPQAADNLLDDIETAILSLCDFPYRYQYSHNEVLRNKGYRKLAIHKYVMLYSVDEENKTVIVMRVFYGAMDYEKYV